jgi:hypothetical protein
VFTWKIARKCGHIAGTIAGSLGRDGYWTIMVDGKAYKAHRLAWLLTTKAWPEAEIDHINRDRSDNRIVNLRASTHSENQINNDGYRNNKSGYKNVHFHKASGKWVAAIRRNNKRRHLGIFITPQEANQALTEKPDAAV